MKYLSLRPYGLVTALAVALLAAGCGTRIDVFPPDVSDNDAAPSNDTTPPPPEDGGTVTDSSPGPFCAAALCMEGTRCCESLRRCLPGGVLCPSEPPPLDAGPGGCRSNADCTSTQYCEGTGCGTPGTCEDRPTVCTREYAPVCGCDGRTYSNECIAQASGARVSTPGECGTVVDAGIDVGLPPRGCSTAADCGRGEECVFPATACTPRGMCMAAIACVRAETFCSCAGETYQGCRPDRPTGSVGACPVTSFCARALCMAGMRCCEALQTCLPAGVACPTDPPDAGVIDAGPGGCRSNADCRTNQYCAGTGCGTAGTCQLRPEACITLYSPVCGCDGRTYGNECDANAAGVRAASRGVCPSVDAGVIDSGTVTACATAADCTRGQECVYPVGTCSVRGTCMAAIACLRAETFCSCAGETFMGCRPDRPTQSVGACPVVSFCATVRCAAGTTCCESLRACIPNGTACPGVDAGVVDAGPSRCASDRDCASGQSCCGFTGLCYPSACLGCCMFPPPDAGPGACRSNADCTSTQYCAGTGCGTAGTCATRPTICTTLYSPVCGCDGRTYSNECTASAAGVRVSTRGECATTVDAGVIDSGTATGCGTAADCARGQECVYPVGTCSVRGTCSATIACLRAETFCSCTGVTYQGCRPDRPTTALGACATAVDAGPGACASDRDCATGTVCCASTGRCYDPRCLACCMPRL